jgi:hypothetical protein
MIQYDSAKDLEAALKRASRAHGEHEAELGYRDIHWPVWYAQYMEQEQAKRRKN